MIRLQEYKPGEIVLPEGELGKGFSILESGALEVIRDNCIISEIEMKVRSLGELSEILGMKRMQLSELRRKHLSGMLKRAFLTL